MSESKTGKCCLCGGGYERYGCNPEPLEVGRCCHSCDVGRVIPARIAIATGCSLKTAAALTREIEGATGVVVIPDRIRK